MAAAGCLVLCCCAGTFVVSVIGAVSDSSAHDPQLVACRAALAAGDQTELATLDDEQRDHGALIVEVGVGLATPPRAWVIAVATALQESGLRNLPHQGADNDHDSLGLFQQRPSQGWGTPEQILDPRYAATAFYRRLLQVEDWQRLPLTVAANAVQRSAHPDAYAKHEPLAVAVVSEVAGGIAAAAAFTEDLRCAELGEVTAAGWTRPAPGPVWSGFRTASRPDHLGIDIGAPRGTEIRAATDGVVTLVTCNATLNGQPYGCDVDGAPAVAGCGWYVTITHPGNVLTRYCHQLRRPDVAVGERVVAGQRIGLVGSSGSSSGPHLHLEVEVHTVQQEDPGGVTVTRTVTDPIGFLAARGVVVECTGSPADCDPVHGDLTLGSR
ncbi:MAG: peptidoglycan DD-metalloendopeptidase family protein [Micromonosporaceae bacterium]|nr:peptidoglycan DD-metalloendopeptidase family protein [Micromonosporaceae bacterium]